MPEDVLPLLQLAEGRQKCVEPRQAGGGLNEGLALKVRVKSADAQPCRSAVQQVGEVGMDGKGGGPTFMCVHVCGRLPRPFCKARPGRDLWPWPVTAQVPA